MFTSDTILKHSCRDRWQNSTQQLYNKFRNLCLGVSEHLKGSWWFDLSLNLWESNIASIDNGSFLIWQALLLTIVITVMLNILFWLLLLKNTLLSIMIHHVLFTHYYEQLVFKTSVIITPLYYWASKHHYLSHSVELNEQPMLFTLPLFLACYESIWVGPLVH